MTLAIVYATLGVAFTFLGVATCQQPYPLCNETTTGLLNMVVIEGCTAGQPCVLLRNTTKNVSVNFTPGEGSQNLTVNLCATLAGECIPFTGFDTRGCLPERNIQCPLAANNTYEYRTIIVVPDEIPPIPRFEVKFELDGDNSPIACFWVDVSMPT